jgi:hypothetical protein
MDCNDALEAVPGREKKRSFINASFSKLEGMTVSSHTLFQLSWPRAFASKCRICCNTLAAGRLGFWNALARSARSQAVSIG